MTAPRRHKGARPAPLGARPLKRRPNPAGPREVEAPRFIGDRAMLELRRQLALDPEAVPQPPPNSAGRSVDRLAFRFCAVAAVAALAGWGVVSFARVRLPAHEVQQARLVPALAVNKAKPVQADVAAPAATGPALAPIEGPAGPQVALAAAAEQTPAPPASMPLWLQQSGIPIAIKAPEPAPPAASSSAAASKPVPNSDEIATLIKRGKAFMTEGDVVTARLLLRRAAEVGSAEAALALGASFDPLIIKQAGAIGVQTDAAQARQWYQKAAALGSEAASKQLAKLASAGQ